MSYRTKYAFAVLFVIILGVFFESASIGKYIEFWADTAGTEERSVRHANHSQQVNQSQPSYSSEYSDSRVQLHLPQSGTEERSARHAKHSQRVNQSQPSNSSEYSDSRVQFHLPQSGTEDHSVRHANHSQRVNQSQPSNSSEYSDARVQLQPPPCPKRTSNTNECVLLFFGAPRLFQKVLKSIQRNIIDPNPGCDIYAHTYNVTMAPAGRGVVDVPGTSDYREVYDLTNATIVHSIEDFEKDHNLTWYHKHHLKAWGECCQSTDNMIKQWHSIQAAWQLMEHCSLESGLNYTRVGLFRLDAFYPEPITIQNDAEVAIVPKFIWYGLTQVDDWKLTNDRMFYGSYEHGKVWATKRFEYIRDYVWKNRYGKKYLQGIHSESFLAYLLEEYRVPVVKKDLCLWRVRSAGYLTTSDCRVLGAPEGQIMANMSDLDLLDDFLCCPKCYPPDHFNPTPCVEKPAVKLEELDEAIISAQDASLLCRDRQTQTHEPPNCALVFFGVPKLLEKVLESIKKNIIHTNPGCDVYAHTYNTYHAPNDLGREGTPVAFNDSDVFQLTNSTLFQTPESAREIHDMEWFESHHYKGWGECCQSTNNMVNQWHSIYSAWKLMDICGTKDGLNYTRVGLFPLDVFFPDPIPIQNEKEEAVVPRFLTGGKTQGGNWNLTNDRIFYGLYNHAKIWATKRFEFAREYVNRFENGTALLQGIYPESLLSHMMEQYEIPIERKDICFWRVEDSGIVTTHNCLANLSRKDNNTGHHHRSNASDDRETW